MKNCNPMADSAYNIRRCCLLVRPEAHAGAERASSEYAAEELHEEREAVALVAACVPIASLMGTWFIEPLIRAYALG